MFTAVITNTRPVEVGLGAVFAGFGSGAVVVSCCCHGGLAPFVFVFVISHSIRIFLFVQTVNTQSSDSLDWNQP